VAVPVFAAVHFGDNIATFANGWAKVGEKDTILAAAADHAPNKTVFMPARVAFSPQS
jgi:hypothetical protein